MAEMGLRKVLVISDDRNISVLLLHFLYTGDMKANVFMQPTLAESGKVQQHINTLTQLQQKF